jgi:hypothetical protein
MTRAGVKAAAVARQVMRKASMSLPDVMDGRLEVMLPFKSWNLGVRKNNN